MAKQYNLPIKGFDQTRTQDLSGLMPLTGGTFTGDVKFPASGFKMIDANGTTWIITVDTDGALISTQQMVEVGSPIGLLLTLTYSE